MNVPSADVIAADPVFQLNVALWCLLPSQGGRYHPVLNSHGYFLHSIGRRLQIPGRYREALAKESGRGVASPDVLADHADGSPMLVIECKASSFGIHSTTSQQATKLLVGASDAAETVGASQAKPAHLLYMTRAGEDAALWATLQTLADLLDDAGLPAASAGTSIIEIDNDGIWVSLGPGGTPPEPLHRALGSASLVVELEEDDVPIPLYIVPWDPGVEQEPRLEQLGKAMLAARVVNEATAAIGRMSVPGSLMLTAAQLLESATFGASSVWRARSEVDRVESLIVSRLVKWMRSAGNVEVVQHSSPRGCQITVRTEQERSGLVQALESVDEWSALEGPEQAELDFG